ncbi:DUF2721 domain-containing protein [Bradyrhizobium manausense]|nr:DUF2721 domain-containing protein [Bradyrhizobium manausense]
MPQRELSSKPCARHGRQGRDASVTSVTDLMPVTPSIDQLGQIIANVAAPAFLLGAVAAFISVLISRTNRVIDRAQFIHGIAANDSARAFVKADLPRLQERARLLNRSQG